MPVSPLPPDVLATIGQAIDAAEGGSFQARRVEPVGGGCISRNFRLADGARRYFVKLGNTSAAAMFAAEADGLAALARCPVLLVPGVVARGRAGEQSFLVLEWLDLQAGGDEGRLGEAVAALHGIAYAHFGWHCDNFIGSTPQLNGWDDDWPRFFAERRLRPQLGMAAKSTPALVARGEALLADLPRFFVDHVPAPGLVHGDLWRGNLGFVAGQPALFDPAIYAGDGETDLAMAELFGGFSPRFFAAYRAVRPLGPGYPARRKLYQLYHVLNHCNLFGGGYASQAVRLLDDLLR